MSRPDSNSSIVVHNGGGPHPIQHGELLTHPLTFGALGMLAALLSLEDGETITAGDIYDRDPESEDFVAELSAEGFLRIDGSTWHVSAVSNSAGHTPMGKLAQLERIAAAEPHMTASEKELLATWERHNVTGDGRYGTSDWPGWAAVLARTGH